MAFIQKTVPPPNKKYEFSINDFSGGLNNKASHTQMKDNQASDLINMSFTEDNLMEKRKGVSKYVETILGEPITFLGEYKPINKTNKLIQATDTAVYVDGEKIADISGTITGVNYIGKFYFADGNGFYVYDGEKVWKIVNPPITHLTQNKSSGFTSFTVEDKIEYFQIGGVVQFELLDGDGFIVREISEIDYDTKTITVTEAVDKDVRTLDLVTPYVTKGLEYVEGSWIYDENLLEAYYAPCKNELDDTYKGGNVIPLKPKIVELRKDRLYLAGDEETPHTVYISDINNGFYFPLYVSMQLPPNSDKVVGMKVFNDALVVGRKEDIYVIYGETNIMDAGNVFYMRKIDTHTGVASHQSMQEVHNYLFFLGSDGVVYRMHTTQTNPELLATSIASQWVDLFSYPLGFDYEDFTTATSIFYKGEYWLSIKDKILVYSYKYMAWTLYDNINATSFYMKDNEILIGNAEGKTLVFGRGYDDDGMPYIAFWASRRNDQDEPSTFKQYREIYIVAQAYEEFVSEIKIKFEVDYVDVKATPIIRNQIAVWGKALWGDRFITRNISPSLPIQVGQRGRLIRIIFANGTNVDAIYQDFDEVNQTIHHRNKVIKVIADDKFYRYNGNEWDEIPKEELFQPMKIHEVNGDYELRGKR